MRHCYLENDILRKHNERIKKGQSQVENKAWLFCIKQLTNIISRIIVLILKYNETNVQEMCKKRGGNGGGYYAFGYADSSA